jgi:C4-dicarboxylate-binding protein DctP
MEVYFKEHFIDVVAERTNGRLVIEPHYSRELGYDDKEMLHVMKDDLVELCAVQTGQLTFEFPWVGATKLPGIIPDPESRNVVKDIDREYIIEPLFNEWDCGVLSLAGTPMTNLMIWFRPGYKPMTPDDWKGLKIRTFTTDQDSFWQKMGATGVRIQVSELYLAMQQGVVDGMTSADDPGTITIRHYDEVAEALAEMWVYQSVIWIGYSKSALSKLPADIQKTFLDAGDEYYELFWNEVMLDPTARAGFEKLAEEKGLVIYRCSDEFYEACSVAYEEVWEEWLQMNKDFSDEAYEKAKTALDALNKATGRA